MAYKMLHKEVKKYRNIGKEKPGVVFEYKDQSRQQKDQFISLNIHCL